MKMNAKQELALLAERMYFAMKAKKEERTGEVVTYIPYAEMGKFKERLRLLISRSLRDSSTQLKVVGCDLQLAERIEQDLYTLQLNTKEQVACYLRALTHGLTNDDVVARSTYVVVLRGELELFRVIGTVSPEWR